MAKPRSFDEAHALSAARDAFWKCGYTATSVADLERATGLSRSSLYAAFGDKHALYGRVLREYQAEYHGAVAEVVARATDFADAASQLFSLAVAGARADGEVGRACRGCLIANATTELSAVDEVVADFVAQNRVAFIDALLPVAEGDDRLTLAPRAACDYVYAVYTGLHALAKSGAGPSELEAVSEAGQRALSLA